MLLRFYKLIRCYPIIEDDEYDDDKELYLDNISYSDTITFIPPIVGGKVIKVYDGDTITIASKLPYDASPLYRFSVRLNGIDCPEIKGSTENEKKFAQFAKLEVTKLVMGKFVELQNLKTEKYGRILADVFINGVHLNAHMIDCNLAVPYDGGTKVKHPSWI
jgi:endonuclease YncB( thermonuclease family)